MTDATNFASEAEIFATNRATGRIVLHVRADRNRTRRAHVCEEGSLRLRFPNAAPELLETVLINTAGGIAGGDVFSVTLSLGAGASLLAGMATAEKIYRSSGPDATITLAINACGLKSITSTFRRYLPERFAAPSLLP